MKHKTREDRREKREDERQVKRREKREERREERWETMKKKREEERENERQNEERLRWKFFWTNVSRPSNPPDELAQHVSKKSLSDELFLHFFCKSSESGRLSLIYMIRIRFFGPRDLILNYFRAAQYSSTPGDVISHLIWLMSWANTLSSTVISMAHSLWLDLSLLPLLYNPIVMESLCYSASEKSEGTLNASHSFTGYEPNVLSFSELNDSSGSFSFMIPSSDQDMDDVTLGKMLTEAHRGQADYCEPEGMSVSQSSLSVVFDRAGKPAGERNVDQSNGFGVTRNTYSAYSRYARKTETHRGPQHYFWIIRKSTRTSKWSRLYERFWGFSGCWISSQWKFPRYQSTSVFPNTSDTWRDVETFLRIAAPQRRAAMHLGHTWYIGKCFCKSTCIFISSLSSRIESMG